MFDPSQTRANLVMVREAPELYEGLMDFLGVDRTVSPHHLSQEQLVVLDRVATLYARRLQGRS
ncbi:MAG: hypothetical protein HQL59_01715 [Magnetococcales bacterium]|nr:hypothetical protein [Magnetococcales bacterium]